MKLTPLDIRRKEFKKAMRGYADEEVDVFLDDVADEFDRLYQENAEVLERVQILEEQVESYSQLKTALEKTLVSAQVQADQLTANSRKEAELILRDAELKSRQIVNESYAETQRVQQALTQLKHLEEDFRFKFQSLLESYLKLLYEGQISPEAPAAGVDATIETERPEMPEVVVAAAKAPETEPVVAQPPVVQPELVEPEMQQIVAEPELPIDEAAMEITSERPTPVFEPIRDPDLIYGEPVTDDPVTTYAPNPTFTPHARLADDFPAGDMLVPEFPLEEDRTLEQQRETFVEPPSDEATVSDESSVAPPSTDKSREFEW